MLVKFSKAINYCMYTDTIHTIYDLDNVSLNPDASELDL